MNDSSSCLQFHSLFSVDIRQDMHTTNAHIMNMIDNMKLNNQVISGCTVWESTDECYKQYRFGATSYFLSYVSSKHSITIDRMVSTSGHGKDIVDGINACDKRYLKGNMCTIGTPEVDDYSKRMTVHSMIGSTHYSFVQE